MPTTVHSDSFTRANAGLIAPYTSAVSGGGSTVGIVSNVLELHTGAVGGWSAEAKFIVSGIASIADGSFEIHYLMPATVTGLEGVIFIFARTDDAWPPTVGIQYQIGFDDVGNLYPSIDELGVGGLVAGSTLAMTASHVLGIKAIFDGPDVKLCLFDITAGQNEGTGNITDGTGLATYQAAGKTQMQWKSGNAAVAKTIRLDDLTIIDLAATAQTITMAPGVVAIGAGGAFTLTVPGDPQTITMGPGTVAITGGTFTLVAPEPSSEIDYNQLWVREIGDQGDGTLLATSPGGNGTVDVYQVRSTPGAYEMRNLAVRTNGARRWGEWRSAIG